MSLARAGLARAGVVGLRVLIVGALVGLLVLSTTGASGEQPGTMQRARLAGQPVRITLPTGEPRGLAIWFHGQGGTLNNRMDGSFLGALVRDGWAVASSNYHLESWGNAASTADTELLIEWAEEQAGVPATLWVSGSMGGTTSLNALNHGVAPPRCWYGVKPAISLEGMGNVPAAPRFIASAYGGPVPDDRNPVRNIDRLPLEVSYRVVSSPDDVWVPIKENAGALAYKLDARGADITYLMATGPHMDPSHWNSQDLLEFAEGCR